MKTNFFIVISMMIIAILAAACVKKFESRTFPIKGTEFSFFSGQNAEKEVMFGIKKNDGTIIAPAIYSNINHSNGYFSTSKGKEFFLLNAKGEEAITGSFLSCVFEINPLNSLQTYFILEKADGKYIFLTKEKTSFGPLADFVLNNNFLFSKIGDKWGVQTTKNELVLPFEFSEIILAKDAKTSNSVFLAKNSNVWSLYDANGKKVKKVPSYNLKQILKSAKEKWGDGEITGITVPNVKKI